MKRFICASLAAFMLFGSTVFADTTANVYINDQLVSYSDQTPIIIDSRTYVPIRDVFEAAGFDVDWDAETKAVTLSNDYHNISLYTQTNSMLSMDTNFKLRYKKLENPIQIVNSRTLLPLREILESANYSLDWDAETKSAKVTDNNDYATLDAQADKFEHLFDENKTYKFDESKPAGEFTSEEYAFLDNMFTVLQDMQKAGDNLGDLENVDEITPETAALVSKLVRDYTSKFSAVECPESLDDMDKKLQDVFDGLVENVLALAQFTQDNPDAMSDDSFGMVFALLIGVAAQASEAVEPLNKICEERNIDIKSVFGDKYSTTDGMSLFDF